MCAPKTPKVEKIPDRQPLLMPNEVSAGSRNFGNGRLRTSSMIFANRNGMLGAPSIAAPLGTRGL